LFTFDQAAQLLDVAPGFIRAQSHDRRGLIFDPKRDGDRISPDELLALGVLKSVQRITGEKSPAAKEIVRSYRPFLNGVLDTPGRTIPTVWIPLSAEGAVTINVQLHIPWLPEWLRQRIELLRSGQPVPAVAPGVMEIAGVQTVVGAGA
jgi:hypothetical protein